jgi:mannose-6-phosphate isomerase-like protein (cupin superfamily)
MRLLVIIFSVMLAAVAVAQEPAAQGRGRGGRGPQPTKTYSSSAEVEALIAEAKSERKENQGLVTKRILTLAPYNANLEYRASIAPAAIHEKDAEVFYVIDGSGTLVTGGKLTGETRTNPENLSGSGIEGGSSRAVAKGDFIVVPEGVPHWFSSINGTLVLMSMRVPRSAPATP